MSLHYRASLGVAAAVAGALFMAAPTFAASSYSGAVATNSASEVVASNTSGSSGNSGASGPGQNYEQPNACADGAACRNNG